MHVVILLVALLRAFSVRATEWDPPLVPISIQVFRDNMAGTSIADISKTCYSKEQFHECGFGSPLKDASVFSVQPNGILKTNVVLGCVPYLNQVSHLVIVVPFYCLNKTTNNPIAMCRAKVHIEILGPVNSLRLSTMCSYDRVVEPVDPAQNVRYHSSLQPSQITPMSNDYNQPSQISRINSGYKKFSVEISAGIGGGSTVLVFLTACLTFKCWLYCRRRKFMDNSRSGEHSGSLNRKNTDQSRAVEESDGETFALADIISSVPAGHSTKGNSSTVKVVVDLSDIPTDVFHKEAHIAKRGALAETLEGLQPDSASDAGRGRQKFQQIQQWVSEQQQLREKQWGSSAVLPHPEQTLSGLLVSNSFATSVTGLRQQTTNEDFAIRPDLETQVITA